MKLLHDVYIGTMFDSIKRYTDAIGEYGRFANVIIYHKCGSSFTGRFKCNYMYDSSRYFTCPHCGRKNDETKTLPIYFDKAPKDMELRLYELKDAIELRAVTNDIVFYPSQYQVLEQAGRTRCTVRFDFKKRQTIITRYVGNSVAQREVFNPASFRSSFFKENSDYMPLYFLRLESYAVERRRDIQDLHRKLCQAFTRKLSDIVGYKVRNVYTPLKFGDGFGAFSTTIRNLALKMVAPDAPRYNYMLVNTGNSNRFQNGFLPDDTFIYTLQGKPFYESVLRAVDIPAKYVKVLQGDLCRVKYIKFALQCMGDNPDLVRRIVYAFSDMPVHFYGQDTILKNWQYYKRLAERFKPSDICNLICKTTINTDKLDEVRMYSDLPHSLQDELFSQRFKLRQLHDLLVKLQIKADKKDVPLKVHDKLTGRYEGLRFISPSNGKVLQEAGVEMHICVGSYVKAVSNEEKVVIVVKNSNKFIACIELQKDDKGRFSVVKQAKLKHNKTVLSNKGVEKAVMNWIADKELIIDTMDLRTNRRVVA